MEPQIALHLFATIAQISGTVLGIYVAITIFAFQDKTLGKLMKREKYVLWLSPAFTWVIATIVAVEGLRTLDLEKPYDDLRASVIVGLFYIALFLLLVRLWLLLFLAKKLSNARE